MELPKYIEILNYKYEILEGEHESKKELHGCVNYGQQQIFINHELHDMDKITTLFHEATHIYLYYMGLSELFTKKQRECVCTVVGTMIYDLFKKNNIDKLLKK